ncbi:hypothetical protein FRB91_006494 [Serendipita sp. 411]|nr:hypothetical protein FRC15_001082 [Serendipita sp. 397]KAG8833974.1 hypothetical protein FRC18_002771 [Serendipita sp. 400]KAG8859836.1 hypothetical protein FRB91_006494 [Serendipita sp. 411]KAG8874046.1 hypothetical protein FRC20_006891 [Serendipita sp. 405]
MDIDTGAPIDTNSHFSVIFPLPYRCLFLVGVGILGWATNLQGLYFLGVDTGYALDLKRSTGSDIGLETHATHNVPSYLHPATLHKPIYRIFAVYSIFTFFSWVFFRFMSAGSAATIDSSKFIPSLTIIVILLALISPWPLFHRHDRMTFLRASLRCLVPSLTQPIYFCDIILADIFTSFAKVIGDFWLAAIILFSRSHLWQLPAEEGLVQWVTPCLMSLPYTIRLRQCLAEYVTTKSRRSLWNALKYSTAFPVIFLSAAQRSSPVEASASPKEHPLFKIWVLSVLINSVYSFWWDVTNDWGLSLLKPSSTNLKRKRSMPNIPANSHRLLAAPSTSEGIKLPPSPSPTDFDPSERQFAGLRPKLFFNDPMIYYMAIFINFILRFTWSLKLSSHLHHIADLEAGVFIIEALEVLRRWIWVFIRVEWEIIKLGGSREAANPEEFEFLMREGTETEHSDIST